MKNFSIKNLYENFETVMVALIAITIIVVFVCRAVSVDGSSMAPTLHDGERLITTNLFYNPQKGDIIVTDKNNILNKPIIKRVIATEGDKIFIDFSTGDVFVNDVKLEEEYILEKIYPSDRDNIEMTIKKDHVFAMGDNRNNSTDSRDLGQISKKNILGKAVLRVAPISSFGIL